MLDRNTFEKLSGMDMQDVLNDPSKFGAPTFDEFKKNRSKYMGRDDDKIASVSSGSKQLKSIESKYVFEVEGYRCKTLEEVEHVASCQGIPLRELEYRAELIPIGAGKANFLVKFMSKAEHEARARIDQIGAQQKRARLISQNR